MKGKRISILVKSIFFAILFFSQTFANSYAQLIKADERLSAYLPLLQDKKVAVVANHTSIVGSTHLVDTLLRRNVDIKIIFTPEHGFKGSEEAGKLINGTQYYKDSIQIISLYGKHKQPSDKDMNGIDVVLFDLQDVGCRFYTYISTLQYVMRSCIDNSKALIVLDRPNPNNFVDGPILRDDCKSFVGLQPIPICYGLTIGEYANMINDENWVDSLLRCDLTVIKMLSYNRDSVYALDVSPSPNLQTMQAIKNYPTLCLFEGTIVSVGRGTNTPFEIIGFPNYSHGDTLFTPKAIKGVAENPPFLSQTCNGKRIEIQNDTIQLSIIIDAYQDWLQQGDNFKHKEKFFNRMFDLLSGSEELKQQILSNQSEQTIRQTWLQDLEAYNSIRRKYLLY